MLWLVWNSFPKTAPLLTTKWLQLRSVIVVTDPAADVHKESQVYSLKNAKTQHENNKIQLPSRIDARNPGHVPRAMQPRPIGGRAMKLCRQSATRRAALT